MTQGGNIAKAAVARADVYRGAGEEAARLVRVLYDDVTEGQYVLWKLGANEKPFRVARTEFATEVVDGAYVWTDDHPFKPGLPVKRPREAGALNSGGRTETAGTGGGGAEPDGTAAEGHEKPKKGKGEAEWEVIYRQLECIGPEGDGGWLEAFREKGYRQALLDRAAVSGHSLRTVGRAHEKWFDYGMSVAALQSGRSRCGGKGKPRMWTAKPGRRQEHPGLHDEPLGVVPTQERLVHFNFAKKYLIENPRANRLKGYDRMCEEFYSDGTVSVGNGKLPRFRLERPTTRQFELWMAVNLPKSTRDKLVKGRAHHKANTAVVTGTSKNVSFRPGSRFQIDGYNAPVNLCTAERNNELENPIVYIVKDQCTNVIMTAWATFGSENADDACTALVRAFCSPILPPYALDGAKVELAVRGFISENLYSDNGGAWLGDVILRLRGTLGIARTNPTKASPRNRGDGEQRGAMAARFLATVPGYFEKKFRKGRNGQRPRVTLSEFQGMMDEWVRLENSTFRQSDPPPETLKPNGATRTPWEMLQWALVERGAPRREPLENLKLGMCEEVKAAVHGPIGYEVNGAFYLPVDHDRPEYAAVMRTGHARRKAVDLARLRDHMSEAWLLDTDGRPSCALELAPCSVGYKAYSVGEYDALVRKRKMGNDEEAGKDGLRRRAADHNRDAIVATATGRTGGSKPLALVPGQRGEVASDARAKVRAEVNAAEIHLAPDGDLPAPPPLRAPRRDAPSLNPFEALADEWLES